MKPSLPIRVLLIAIATTPVVFTGGSLAQKSSTAGWPSSKPEHRAYLCGETAAEPEGYVAELNKAVLETIEVASRAGRVVGEKRAFELIVKRTCISLLPAQ